MCICGERWGRGRKGNVLVCVGASVCGNLGVGIEGEMDIGEETHVCAETQLQVC